MLANTTRSCIAKSETRQCAGKTLWAPALRRAFPHLQPQRRDLAYSPVYELNRLRNRIAHHEPIHDRNLNDRHRDLLRVTGFIDPAAQAWLSSRSRTPAVLQSRPR